MEKLSLRVAEACVQRQLIKSDNTDVVVYGLTQFTFFLFNFFIIEGIGLALGRLPEATIYCAVYLTLSGFTGSFHARNRIICSIKTISVFCGYLLAMSWLVQYAMLWIPLGMIVTFAVISYCFVPVDHKNKKWSPEERVHNRRKVLVLSLLYITAAGFLWYYNIQWIVLAIALSMFIVGLFAFLGHFFNEQ